MTTKILSSKAAATKMTKTLKLLKMQQFMFLMILMVIVNAAMVSAKMSEEEALEKELLEFRKKCMGLSKLTKEQAKKINQHTLFSKDTTLANTPREVQCYCSCILEQYGILVNGKPNEKTLRQTLPVVINDKKKADAALDKCTKLEGKDKCEIGFNFQLCVVRETGLQVFQ
ncbi:general odorant-binding protein 56a-like [Lucilia sericata]|uniref:general odorant-binding protein 56a-like n=1 Tax=Lucilia sericata TaxID=13632 RepID=UPI0018A7ED88|nr:general odorant-binding protein 56a-like [Lucilia sericata]